MEGYRIDESGNAITVDPSEFCVLHYGDADDGLSKLTGTVVS